MKNTVSPTSYEPITEPRPNKINGTRLGPASENILNSGENGGKINILYYLQVLGTLVHLLKAQTLTLIN